MEQHSGKLVLAILQGEDYEDTVYGISKFRPWIYGFGSSAIVLEPVSLREHIIQSLKERKNR